MNITTTTKVQDSATAQNGSGGLIAASDVQCHDQHRQDGGLTHFPGSNTYAFVGKDIGANTITGDSGAIQVDGGGVSIIAGGNIQIASSSFQDTYNKTSSSSGGLGDGSLAESDTTVYDNAAAVVGANASVTGQTVRVNSDSSAKHYGRAEDTVYRLRRLLRRRGELHRPLERHGTPRRDERVAHGRDRPERRRCAGLAPRRDPQQRQQ